MDIDTSTHMRERERERESEKKKDTACVYVFPPVHSTIEQLQRTQGYQNDMSNAGVIVTFLRYGPTLDRFTAQLIASVVPAFLPATDAISNPPQKVSFPSDLRFCLLID